MAETLATAGWKCKLIRNIGVSIESINWGLVLSMSFAWMAREVRWRSLEDNTNLVKWCEYFNIATQIRLTFQKVFRGGSSVLRSQFILSIGLRFITHLDKIWASSSNNIGSWLVSTTLSSSDLGLSEALVPLVDWGLGLTSNDYSTLVVWVDTKSLLTIDGWRVLVRVVCEQVTRLRRQLVGTWCTWANERGRFTQQEPLEITWHWRIVVNTLKHIKF